MTYWIWYNGYNTNDDPVGGLNRIDFSSHEWDYPHFA